MNLKSIKYSHFTLSYILISINYKKKRKYVKNININNIFYEKNYAISIFYYK